MYVVGWPQVLMSKETGKPEIDDSRMKCIRPDQQRNLTEQVAEQSWVAGVQRGGLGEKIVVKVSSDLGQAVRIIHCFHN